MSLYVCVSCGCLPGVGHGAPRCAGRPVRRRPPPRAQAVRLPVTAPTTRTQPTTTLLCSRRAPDTHTTTSRVKLTAASRTRFQACVVWVCWCLRPGADLRGTTAGVCCVGGCVRGWVGASQGQFPRARTSVRRARIALSLALGAVQQPWAGGHAHAACKGRGQSVRVTQGDAAAPRGWAGGKSKRERESALGRRR